MISRDKTFAPGDPVCDALFVGRKAQRNQMKQYAEGPIEVLPGIWSNDRLFLRFKDELSRLLTRQLPETVDDFGRVMGNGVRSNFYSIRHVNGFPMKPATWPVVDNTLRRSDSNLADNWVETWHENIFRAIVRLFFSDLEAVPMKVRKGSSSVMPYFTVRMPDKLDIARYSQQHAETAGKLMMKGDYATAWLTYRIGGAAYVVYRRQSTDKVDLENGKFVAKPREVADLEYALSGGANGSVSPASKSMDDVDFRVPDGFFRERNRTAFGVPWGINSTLVPIAQSVRKKIYGKYGWALHHTTRHAMQADLRDMSFLIAADVSSHDQFWPMFKLDTIVSELEHMGFPEWWVKLYDVKGRIPFYVTDVSETEGNLLLGDWRNPDLKAGLNSGNAFTDIEGTMGMISDYLILQIEHTAPEFIRQCKTIPGAMQVVDAYLKGELPIRIKDKSDDALLAWEPREKIPAAQLLMEKMQKGEQVSPYMVISYEHGGAFLGNLLLYPENGDVSGMVLTGDISSLVRNMFSPEYSVQSQVRDRSKVKRPFPGLAWETLPEVYGTAPAYSEVMEIIEHVWRSVYGESYRGFRDRMLLDDKRRLREYIKENESASGLRDLSLIDQEVLANPDKLQYKYDPSDVNPALVDMLFNGLPLDEVEPYFNSIVRNV